MCAARFGQMKLHGDCTVSLDRKQVLAGRHPRDDDLRSQTARGGGDAPHVDAAAAWPGSLHQPDHADHGADRFNRIDWSTIGEPTADPTPAQNMAEIWNMAARATARADGYTNQTLRATADVELLHGPDYRVDGRPGFGRLVPDPVLGELAPRRTPGSSCPAGLSCRSRA